MAQVVYICSYGKRFPRIAEYIEHDADYVVEGLRLQRNPELHVPVRCMGWDWDCLTYVPRAQQVKNSCVTVQNQKHSHVSCFSVLFQNHIL